MDAIRIGLGDITGARLLDLAGATGVEPDRDGIGPPPPAAERAFGPDRVTLGENGDRLTVYRPPAPPPPEPPPEWEVLAAKAAASGPWFETENTDEAPAEEEAEQEQSTEDQAALEREVAAEARLRQAGQLAELIRQIQEAKAAQSLTDQAIFI